jgi:hypothetical protein
LISRSSTYLSHEYQGKKKCASHFNIDYDDKIYSDSGYKHMTEVDPF